MSHQHLTKAQVRKILDLAESRHIKVVPEIDSPGHLGAVIAAHPGLQLRNAQGVAASGAVDIANPESAEVVDELLDEYAGLFPGAYWHLGGDEYRALIGGEPRGVLPGAGRRRAGEVRIRRDRRRPRDRLAERPRQGDARPRPDRTGLERRVLPRGASVQADKRHPGRVLDGQGDRGPAAGGVSERRAAR